MSTLITEQPKQSTEGKVISYVPLGGKNTVELTMSMVKKFLCTPTRNGNIASDSDIVKFMMLCKARELDPWVGDAYLVGYDSNDGPVFSLITAAQALLKRAEISPEYDGMESGVVVSGKEGVIEYREGDLVLDGETLVGGWARCFRKNHGRPSFDALKLATFTTGKSRWAKDPAGMIVKCAESSALRKAFPTQLGGLYSKEEMEHLSDVRIDSRAAGNVAPVQIASNLDQLAEHIERDLSQSELPRRTEKPKPESSQPAAIPYDETEAPFNPDAGMYVEEPVKKPRKSGDLFPTSGQTGQ